MTPKHEDTDAMGMESQRDEGLKPCPFCGGEARTHHYETESLWSHDQVTYNKVYCDECDVGFEREPGHELQAAEAWNRRATTQPAEQTGLRQAIAAFLKERDEHVEPHEADDEERTASAEAIISLIDKCGPAEQSASSPVEGEGLVEHMVQRFLAWRLPENLAPDGGLNFDRSKVHPAHWPSGTNFLDYRQAEAMIRHILEGAPK